MLNLVGQLTTLLREVCPEAYYEWNGSENVTYPYLTFDLDGEYLGRNQDGYTVDIDIFDKNSSYANVFELEEAIKQKLCFARIMRDDFFLMVDYRNSHTVPTGDVTIKRRTITLYVQVDWRKENGIS